LELQEYIINKEFPLLPCSITV